MVITLRLNQLFKIEYARAGNKIKVVESLLNNQDTYFIIFNKEQYMGKEMYETLFNTPGVSVLYQSPPAVNKIPGHGKDPRNFLVIFEYEKPVQAVPEVSVAG